MMINLARHCGGEPFECSPGGHVRFTCDDWLDVTLTEDIGDAVIRATVVACGSADHRIADGADWEVNPWEDGASGAMCRHPESGLVAVTAEAPAAQLDSVRFPGWLSQLLDRAAEVIAAQTRAREIATEPGTLTEADGGLMLLVNRC